MWFKDICKIIISNYGSKENSKTIVHDGGF